MILRQLDVIQDEGSRKTLFKKMAPPLVTLLSAESEIQYVALRNIHLVVAKYPSILAHEVKVGGLSCVHAGPRRPAFHVDLPGLSIHLQIYPGP